MSSRGFTGTENFPQQPQHHPPDKIALVSSQLDTVIRLLTEIDYKCGLSAQYLASMYQQSQASSPAESSSTDTIMHHSTDDTLESNIPSLADMPLVEVDSTTQISPNCFAEYFELFGHEICSQLDYKDIPYSLISIACYMGDNYAELLPLINHLKANNAVKKDTTLSVKNKSIATLGKIRALAEELNRIAFLENFSFYGAPRATISTRSSASPAYISFITGKWFEYYTMCVAIRTLKSLNLPYQITSSIIMKNETGRTTELDVIFFVNSNIYWIECKTGAYQGYMQRYETILQDFLIPASHSFLVLSACNADTCRNLNQLYKLNVCNLETFETKLREVLSLEVDKLSST